MTAPKIKATYSLDTETVKLIDRLARRWKTSKSETLRRAIRDVAANEQSAPTDPEDWIAEFRCFQRSLGSTEADLREWARKTRAMRRAGSGHRGL